MWYVNRNLIKMMDNIVEVTCVICDKQFKMKKNLYAHMRNIHKVEPKILYKKTLMCHVCNGKYTTYNDLREHFVESHDLEVTVQEVKFSDKENFLMWKENLEKNLKCRYIQNTGMQGNKTYYVCHRSYRSRTNCETPSTSRTKLAKSQGSVKMNYTCPSTLEYFHNEKKINLFLPHSGHICSLKFLNLTKNERRQIADKITDGVTFNNILDNIRDGVTSSSEVNRVTLIDRQDLRNIKKEFHLQGHFHLHTNDVLSVKMWIQKMSNKNDESPILFSKFQDTPLDNFDVQDFILILSTKYQQEQLLKFGADKVCIDSTHGTTSYDFLLTTLVVVDEYGEGVPCAFLISNRINTHILSYFFEIIKNKLGNIKATVFMSDDAPEFYNAWSSIMGHPTHRLLCTWHVDRNWRKNLTKVKGQELRAKVYKALRILLESTDTEEFNECLHFFLVELLGSNDTKTFGEYFQKYYSDRAPLWAFCYRKGLGINTNMYLEAIHRTIKYIYFDGKKNRRLDACIYALIKMVRDCMFKKLKKDIKGAMSYRIKLIQRSHLRGNNIDIKDISFEKDFYYVKSQHDKDERYTVKDLRHESIEHSSCPCQLSCRECNVCVHQFSCTCIDYFIKFNLCKHIHAVMHFLTLSTEEQRNCKPEISDDSIIQTFISHCGSESPKLKNEEILAKLGVLSELVSTRTLSLDEEQNIIHFVDKCIDICSNNVLNYKSTKNEPSNKKIEKQPRFESSKRKRNSGGNIKLKKPSLKEQKDFINECVNANQTDHSYLPSTSTGIFH